MSERKFKVGDVVRIRSGPYSYQIGTIHEDDGDPENCDPYWIKVGNSNCCYSDHELELAKPAPVPVDYEERFKALLLKEVITERNLTDWSTGWNDALAYAAREVFGLKLTIRTEPTITFEKAQ